MKNAILKTYVLVPEAYHRKFRNYHKQGCETHVEFAHEKEVYFDKWSRKVGTDFWAKVYNSDILNLAYESSIGGHLGIKCVERFHSTFPNNEKDWDEGISLLLFAVGDSVQEF